MEKNHNYSVLSLLKEIKKIWPSANWLIKNGNKEFKESNLLKLNCKKAKKIINWFSIFNFKENIKMTIEWYKKYYETNNIQKMKKLSEYQIKEFTKLIKKRSK